MRGALGRRVAIVLVGIVAVIAAGAVLAHNALAAWLLGSIAGSSTGTSVSIGHADVGTSSATLTDVVVRSKAGEPIATIPRIDATYDLHDLITESGRLLGLKTLDVVRPQITVIHHADGTFNIPFPKNNKPAKPGPPVILRGSITGGTVTGIEQLRGFGAPLRITNLHASFDLDSIAASTYSAGLIYHENGRSYAIDGSGAMDARSRIAMHRWHVPPMPVARLADFAVGNPNVRFVSGSIAGATVRAFTLGNASGVAATTDLRGVQIDSPALAKPMRDLRARLDVSSNAALFEGLRGTLGSLPLHGSGGIYDLAHPSLRFALDARGDLAQLRGAIAQAQRLPISGDATLHVLAQGPVSAPLIAISAQAPRVRYLRTTIRGVSALAAFEPNELDVISARAAYDGFTLGARGRIALASKTKSLEMLAEAGGTADRIPYAGQMLGGMPLDGTVLATADTLQAIDTRGIITGTGRSQRLAAMFAVTSAGTGTIGPLVLDGSRGDLYALAAVDHPANDHSALVVARNLQIEGGTVDARILGTLTRGHPAAIGTGRVRNLRFANVAVDDGTFAAALNGNALSALAADVRSGGARVLASSTSAGRIALSVQNFALFGGSVSSAGFVRAVQTAPSLTSTILAQHARYDGVPLSAMTSATYRHGTLAIANAAIGAGPANVTVAGTVGGLTFGQPLKPRYDLNASVRAADIRALAAIAAPSRARLLSGSIDGSAHIGGTGSQPRVHGTLLVPEGSVNGLAFTGLHGAFTATPQQVAVANGGVTVGTTAVSFHGDASRGAVSGAFAAPHADLADFDDFFNTGDTLGGRGEIGASFAYGGGAVQSTGSATFANLRYERLTIDSAQAGWSTNGNHIALAVLAGGRTGQLQTSGTVNSRTHAIDLAMNVQALDLNAWLPPLGIQEPVSGYLDASGSATGTFPDIDSSLQARVVDGTAGPFPLQVATVALHTIGGRGRIDAANLQVPDLSATASGTFGFHSNDALAIAAHVQSNDIGKLAQEATGKPNPFGGSVDTTLNVGGTPRSPTVAARAQLTALRYGKLAIPRVVAQGSYAGRALTISQAEADFTRGRVTLSARSAPFGATFTAQDLELSNFAALLPQGTHLSGRIDGTVRASGALDNPSLTGLLALTHASYSGPQESTPIAGGAQLAFAGPQIRLQNAAFTVGGGTLTANAVANVPSLRDPRAATLTANAVAKGATVDLPAYYKGRIDGSIAVHRAAGAAPVLGGNVTLSSARLPVTAFLAASGSGSGAAAFPLAFHNLTIVAGSDVRVQSPNVDVGAQGSLTLNGTLADLSPSGRFHSTGGTVSFYRTFTIDRAAVAFSPQSGIIPTVNASATTFVEDPSYTQITLHVRGPATGMQTTFDSTPSYDRSQILAMLAGAGSGGSFSATGEAESLAEGQVNTLFTRNLLEPLDTALQSTLGFANVQLTSNIAQGEYGAQFVHAFGHSVHGIFNESFGYPERTSFTLQVNPNPYSDWSLTAYTQPDLTLFPLSQPPGIPPPGTVGQAAQTIQLPLSGTNGLGFAYERRYW